MTAARRSTVPNNSASRARKNHMENNTQNRKASSDAARIEAAALFVAFGALLIYAAAGHIALPKGTAFALSPYLFPGIAGLAGTAASAALFTRSKHVEGDRPHPLSRESLNGLCMLALGLLLAIGMEYLGFLPSAALYLFAACLILGERRPLALILFPALFAAALWALFRFAFGVLM